MYQAVPRPQNSKVRHSTPPLDCREWTYSLPCIVPKSSLTLRPYGQPRKPTHDHPSLLEDLAAMSLSTEQRQVLELLAGSPRGYTKGRLLADGFTVDTLADLVREGLATAQRGTLGVGGRTIRVERYRITDAGRRAID
jgi:hypothetical protein